MGETHEDKDRGPPAPPQTPQPSPAAEGRLTPTGCVALKRSRFVRNGLKHYNPLRPKGSEGLHSTLSER